MPRTLIALLPVAALLVACETDPTPSPTVAAAVPTPDPFEVVIPRSDELVPAGAAGVTEWSVMPGLPDAFDASLAYPSATDAAEAFGAALREAASGPGPRPTLQLDAYRKSELAAVLVVSRSAMADDSLAGTQWALDLNHDPDGWVLYGIWQRHVCVRGVDPTGQFCV